MMTLVSSWNAVPLHVIFNCFSKAGISDPSQQAALSDEDDPFKELTEELDELREAHPDAEPENFLAESFSAVDGHMVVAALAASDSKILPQILRDKDDSDEKVVTKDKLSITSFKKENRKRTGTLQNVSLFANKYSSKIQILVLQLETLMDPERK